MTRILQFIPPLDVKEKVITYLLAKAGKTPEQQLAMSGEDVSLFSESKNWLSMFANVFRIGFGMIGRLLNVWNMTWCRIRQVSTHLQRSI